MQEAQPKNASKLSPAIDDYLILFEQLHYFLNCIRAHQKESLYYSHHRSCCDFSLNDARIKYLQLNHLKDTHHGWISFYEKAELTHTIFEFNQKFASIHKTMPRPSFFKKVIYQTLTLLHLQRFNPFQDTSYYYHISDLQNQMQVRFVKAYKTFHASQANKEYPYLAELFFDNLIKGKVTPSEYTEKEKNAIAYWTAHDENGNLVRNREQIELTSLFSYQHHDADKAVAKPSATKLALCPSKKRPLLIAILALSIQRFTNLGRKRRNRVKLRLAPRVEHRPHLIRLQRFGA